MGHLISWKQWRWKKSCSPFLLSTPSYRTNVTHQTLPHLTWGCRWSLVLYIKLETQAWSAYFVFVALISVFSGSCWPFYICSISFILPFGCLRTFFIVAITLFSSLLSKNASCYCLDVFPVVPSHLVDYWFCFTVAFTLRFYIY